MKFRKKGLCAFTLLIAVVLSMSMSANVSAIVLDLYDDVSEDSWYFYYVNEISKYGLMNGTSSTTFNPEGNIKRGDFAAVIGRLHEKYTEEEISDSSVAFIDVYPDSYYAKYIYWAAENEIVSGYDGRIFMPESYITREEMATMLYNYLMFDNVEFATEPSEWADVFKDYNDIADWAIEGVTYLRSYDIILGHEDGYYYPQSNATRAQVAKIFLVTADSIGKWAVPD